MIPTGASPATFYLSPPGLRSKWPAHVCQCWCPVWLRSPFWDSHRTVVPLCWVMLSHFFKRAETKSRCILCYTLIYIYIYIFVWLYSHIYIYMILYDIILCISFSLLLIYIYMYVCYGYDCYYCDQYDCIWPFGRVT